MVQPELCIHLTCSVEVVLCTIFIASMQANNIPHMSGHSTVQQYLLGKEQI